MYVFYYIMNKIVKGSNIDITLCPWPKDQMGETIERMNERFNKEEDDRILGYIIDDLFFTLDADNNNIGVKNHYSLNFVKDYTDKCWVVLNKHPNQIYSPMANITGCYTFNVEEFDIWSDERSSSLIAVITGLDCD